jgi:hypothetical protein
VHAAGSGSELGVPACIGTQRRGLSRRNRKKAHGHRGIPGRPADGPVAGAGRVLRPMAMSPALVPAAYHRPAPGSGDIPIPHDGQLHVSDPSPVGLAHDRLPMEKDGDTVVAQAGEATPADNILTTPPSHLADIPPPPTAVAYPAALSANNPVVSHISLSTRRSWVAGN